MNLSHLRYFVHLTQTRHYTKAAEQLYISQPSLSHAIAQLEHELGVSLFEKSGRNVELTQFGESFLDSVTQALNILDDSVAYLQHCAKGNGVVRLGLLRTLGVEYIPGLVSDYLRQHPELKLEFSFFTGVTYALLDKLKRHELDIVFGSRAPEEYKLLSVPVTRQELVLVVPADHPLAAQPTVDLAELGEEPFIQFAPGSGLRYVVDDLFRQAGITPRTAYEIQEDQVIAGLVAHGFGIAIVPYMEMLLRLNVKILQIARPRPDRRFYLVTDPAVSLSPAASGFRDFVLSRSQFH
ncbi:MAG: LysR family transcriptional regulator [Candidatus Limivicinus sp.]|nr:LysR family transcriptional regulator [Candidatus Limivicinus sp.]